MVVYRIELKTNRERVSIGERLPFIKGLSRSVKTDFALCQLSSMSAAAAVETAAVTATFRHCTKKLL
jgi:hypothetical protein